MDIPMLVDCKESKFGCCYDGVMRAAGPNKLGCPESYKIWIQTLKFFRKLSM